MNLGSSLYNTKIINVKGKEAIEGKIGGLKFKISPKAFFQLNTKQTVVLYDEIKKACRLTGEENILDCYCGIGSIGLYLADQAKEVRGIDVNIDLGGSPLIYGIMLVICIFLIFEFSKTTSSNDCDFWKTYIPNVATFALIVTFLIFLNEANA